MFASDSHFFFPHIIIIPVCSPMFRISQNVQSFEIFVPNAHRNDCTLSFSGLKGMDEIDVVSQCMVC